MVLQAVLGLSGAVEIATAGVSKYVEAFNNFAFLWQRDLASEYAKFVATHPTREVGLYASFLADKYLCCCSVSLTFWCSAGLGCCSSTCRHLRLR